MKAEAEFDLLITTDRNLRHQQNLPMRKLAIVVLPTTSWPHTGAGGQRFQGFLEGEILLEWRQARREGCRDCGYLEKIRELLR